MLPILSPAAICLLLQGFATQAVCFLPVFPKFGRVQSLACDSHMSSCTSGKAIIDDPNFPAFPESAEEAHARINAVLQVSTPKWVFCMLTLTTV